MRPRPSLRLGTAASTFRVAITVANWHHRRGRGGEPIGLDVDASEVAVVAARAATELPLIVKADEAAEAIYGYLDRSQRSLAPGRRRRHRDRPTWRSPCSPSRVVTTYTPST